VIDRFERQNQVQICSYLMSGNIFDVPYYSCRICVLVSVIFAGMPANVVSAVGSEIRGGINNFHSSIDSLLKNS